MLYALLEATAQRHAERVAITADERSLTFADLLRSVDGFAATLSSAGVDRGDTVVLVLPNNPEFVVATFATAKLGAILVPLNPQYQADELRYYFEDSQARVVVTSGLLEGTCRAIINDLGTGTELFVGCPETGGSDTGPAAGRRPVADTGLYQYSSGSTGVPKRVVRTQAHLLSEANHFRATVEVVPEDRFLGVVPLFHAHGFANCMMAAVAAGAEMVLLEAFHRQRVLDALVDGDVTIFPAVPFMIGILADSSSIDDVSLDRLKLAFTAGGPLSKESYDKFLSKFSVPVKQLYGSTETGSITINLGSTDGDRWASVGPPMKGIEIDIVDDDGEVLGPGQVGEIAVRSAATTAGYAGLDEVNRRTFKDGAFYSGDLGRKDEEGNLYVTGRKRLFINAGGYKVDPGEVEGIVQSHPKVREVVVVGVAGRYDQEVVKAVVVPAESCSGDEIKDWCKGKVADFKIPRIVEFRDEIPRSPVGKILRKYLVDELSNS